MNKLPTLFVSHGAPSLIIEDCPARDFLKNLSSKIERPKAILVISAHWETKVPTITSGVNLETIYDFGGFPDELYKIKYEAKGSPKLAAEIQELLKEFEAELDESRGLDHGAWVPLKLIYPEADIPVLQLSILRHVGAWHHYQIGKKLKTLRDKGVLIIGTGSITHNLRSAFGSALNAAPDARAKNFAEWVAQTLANNDKDSLLAFYSKAPDTKWNHPTTEHFYPLIMAYAAAGDDNDNVKAERMHKSFTYSSLAMDVYKFS